MTSFGQYELREIIGRGGLAEVWRARAPDGRELALKLIRVDARAPAARLLIDEAEVMSALHHPHIVRVEALVEAEGQLGLAMELCVGSLADFVRAKGPLPAWWVCEVGGQAASALAEAHRNGVIHRDIKPANLLIAKDGAIKLADFGIAALLDDRESRTETSALWGTLPFLAPERRHGERATARSDLYGLACTLAWLGTGRMVGDLYVPAVLEELRRKLPEPLVDALAHAGRYDMRARPESAQAWAESLAAAQASLNRSPLDLAELPRGSRLDTFVSTAPHREPRSNGNRWPILLSSISAVLAAGSAIVVAVTSSPRDPASTPGDKLALVDDVERAPQTPIATAGLAACEDFIGGERSVVRLGPRETVGAMAADLDADGWPDAVFTNQLDESLTIYWGGEGRVLEAPERYPLRRSNGAAVAVDLDRDGDLDLLTPHQDDALIAVHENHGERSFRLHSTIDQAPPAHSVGVLDWDRDGELDLLMQITLSSECSALRRGTGGFSFEPYVCIGPSSELRQPYEPSGPRILRQDSTGRLVVHSPGPAASMAEASPVFDPGPNAAVEIASVDAVPGAEIYVISKRDDVETLLRVNWDGNACRLMAAKPPGYFWNGVTVDLDRNGIPDRLGYLTCAGCESNHSVLLGLAGP